jgi:predicted short-subunit dehydrogenase-like oxidoreductase (DUF2520 family)
MKKPRGWNIAIVGAGRVGQTLGRILVENGNRITCVVSRSRTSALRAGRFLKCRLTSTSLDAIPSDVDLIFIATPHGAVEGVAHELSRLDSLPWRRISVCHASGMLTASVLEPLRKMGATVFSFHPLQTFPRDLHPKNILPNARAIHYGIDGTDDGVRRARQLAKRLEGKVLLIEPQHRVLYHAACVVASNHLTALLANVETMFTVLGTEAKKFSPVFDPIIMATLRNCDRHSPATALSGPVARGGVETVAEHFSAVRQFTPELIPYFATMTQETIRLARAKGSINSYQEHALIQLVRDGQTRQEKEHQ